MSNQPDPYEILALALTGLEQVEEWTHEKGLTPADGWGSTTGLLRGAKFEQVQGVQLQGAQQDYVKRFKPDVETFRLALGILRND